MRSEITLNQYARGHMVCSRSTAIPLREEAELVLARGYEVVFDFSGVAATQSFIDELIGGLILRRGLEVLERIVFKSCSDDVRAIIEFVAADRCDQYLKTHTH
jgi:hypothetical protein